MAVLSLMLFEGADGSAVFTDTTGNQTWAIQSGGPTISTARFKQGASSLLIDTDEGIVATLASPIPDTSDNTSDYHAECWVWPDSATWGASTRVPLCLGPTYWKQIRIDSNGKCTFYSPFYGALDGNLYVRWDDWNHVAISKRDGVTKAWLNGAQIGGSWSNAYGFSQIFLGDPTVYNSPFRGNIDGFRVIDEWLFQASFFGNPDPDPGLTYTQQGLPGMVILDRVAPVAIQEPIFPPLGAVSPAPQTIQGQVLDRIQLAEPQIFKIGSGSGGEIVYTPIQIWG